MASELKGRLHVSGNVQLEPGLNSGSKREAVCFLTQTKKGKRLK